VAVGTPGGRDAPVTDDVSTEPTSGTPPAVEYPEVAPFSNARRRTHRAEINKRFGVNHLAPDSRKLRYKAKVVHVEDNRPPPPYVRELFAANNLVPVGHFHMKVRVEVFSSWLSIPGEADAEEIEATTSLFPNAWLKDEGQEKPGKGDDVWVSLVDDKDFLNFIYEGKRGADLPVTLSSGIQQTGNWFDPCEGRLEIDSVLAHVMGTPILAVCGLPRPVVDVEEFVPPFVPKSIGEIAPPVGILKLGSSVVASPVAEQARIDGKAAFLEEEYENPHKADKALKKAWNDGQQDGYKEAYNQGIEASSDADNPYSAEKGSQSLSAFVAWSEGSKVDFVLSN